MTTFFQTSLVGVSTTAVCTASRAAREKQRKKKNVFPTKGTTVFTIRNNFVCRIFFYTINGNVSYLQCPAGFSAADSTATTPHPVRLAAG